MKLLSQVSNSILALASLVMFFAIISDFSSIAYGAGLSGEKLIFALFTFVLFVANGVTLFFNINFKIKHYLNISCLLA
jgi:hypothetical protein